MGFVYIDDKIKQKQKIIILNQNKDTLRMVSYLDCDSVFPTEADKLLVKYDVIRKCPPRIGTQGELNYHLIEVPSSVARI